MVKPAVQSIPELHTIKILPEVLFSVRNNVVLRLILVTWLKKYGRIWGLAQEFSYNSALKTRSHSWPLLCGTSHEPGWNAGQAISQPAFLGSIKVENILDFPVHILFLTWDLPCMGSSYFTCQGRRKVCYWNSLRLIHNSLLIIPLDVRPLFKWECLFISF